MAKRFAVVLAVLMCVCSGTCMAAGKSVGKGVGEVKVVKPTKENVLGLADKYLKACQPKLDFKGKQTIDEIKTKLFMSKGLESEKKKTVDSLVNQLTVALAGMKDAKVLTVASAILVQTSPDNIRTANLFGSVLHATNKLDESVIVLEYALSLKPSSSLAMLNLGNAYLDVKRDEKARAMAEKVLKEEDENQGAHRLLATYWYNKGNLARFRDELLKAAKFKGYVRKKTEKKHKKTEENMAEAGDSAETLEQKALAVKDEVPVTTADVIEDDFPAAAKQIRDKYGKLVENEKFVMPKLPMVNTNTAQEFTRNQPIMEAWMGAFIEKTKKYAMQDAAAMGIDVNAGEAAMQAQAKAAAKKQMAEAMQQAQDSLKFLEGMKGVSKAQLDQARKALQKVSKQQGVSLKDKPVSKDVPPSFDSGSQFAAMNYANYSKISNTYECYFFKYYREYQAKVMDIAKVYGSKVREENEYHEKRMEELQKEHHGYAIPAGDCANCLREVLRHKRKINELGENYYKQWVNLYMPQYAQKMKPTLDAYWSVCGLYIRNMNDPKVMQREYVKVRKNFLFWGSQAVSGIAVGGGFKYEPLTDEEEAELEAAIAAAEQEAVEKKPEFERECKQPDTDWSKWIEDHLVLEVSGEFLSLKVTAKTIEFEAWAFGPGAGIKVDLVDETMETYTGVGAKFKVGVNVGGFEVGAEAKTDFARKTAKWDFANGTYEESYGAKGEAKAAFGAVAASGEYEVNTELEAKIAGKITAGDMFTVQDEVSSK